MQQSFARVRLTMPLTDPSANRMRHMLGQCSSCTNRTARLPLSVTPLLPAAVGER